MIDYQKILQSAINTVAISFIKEKSMRNSRNLSVLRTRIQLTLRSPLRPIVRFLLFFFYSTHYVEGTGGELSVGKRVGLANTLCNLSSGNIVIGDFCAFGYNVMLLTGRHRFENGRRASLGSGGSWGGDSREVPEDGFDIIIEDGCWIASGAIISGGVTIGSNSIVAAGSVVLKSFPRNSVIAGVPAKLTGSTLANNVDPSAGL
jgi:acetyltransferase-like isoleucine patch superfamily enzyme